jgi:uncharacterized repeat protein (TIGR03803 family)
MNTIFTAGNWMMKARLWAVWFVTMVVFELAPSTFAGVAFTTVYSFTDGDDGAHPVRLISGKDGFLYGVALLGGPYVDLDPSGHGYGTIFRISMDGVFASLGQFAGTNGSVPNTLLRGDDGNFYGTASEGGFTNTYGFTSGTVFKMTPSGVLSTVIAFNDTNHWEPNRLIQAANGNFYGVVESWREFLFLLTTNGDLTDIMAFTSTNGVTVSSLLQSSDGNIYGATQFGGNDSNAGTLFKITLDGEFTSMFAFSQTNGSSPRDLVQVSSGDFYGITDDNSGVDGLGTVFRWTPGGAVVSLSSFDGTNGANPSGIAEGSDGNFYGTCWSGGLSGQGTLFRATPHGTLSCLHSFSGSDGSLPLGPLVQGPDGNFYGITHNGGAYTSQDPAGFGYGTIFRLSVPLPPVLKSISATNGGFTLTWTSVATQTYQVQYKSDLISTNWISLGDATVATGGTMSAFDNASADAQRFYRVVLLP